MKYLRSVDSLSYSLASSQARIFENSVSSGIPSKLFVRSFMLSNEVKLIDDLKLEAAGLSDIELFDTISKRIKSKNGELYSFEVMHYIGYFYRMAAYLTGCSSAKLYSNIKPSFLSRNYNTLHSLTIEEAIEEAFEITKTELDDKYLLFKRIYTFKD